MSFKKMQDREIQQSFDAIYRLGHCGNYDEEKIPFADSPVEDNSFEIGVWEPVPVERTTRKKKRHRAEREPIDIDNIDFSAHLHTPRIVNMKELQKTPWKFNWNGIVKPEIDLYTGDPKYCFCYVCLIRWNLSPKFPKKLVLVTASLDISKLTQGANIAECVFRNMMSTMNIYQIPRPLELSYAKCDYEKVLKFFEHYCRVDALDIGIILNDFVVERQVDNHDNAAKSLHEVFKALVYASAAKVLFKIIADYLPRNELREKTLLFVQDINQFDPFRFLEYQPSAMSNIEKNVLRLY